MNHLCTKKLETEWLILRRFTAEDAQSMFNNGAGDADCYGMLRREDLSGK